MEKSAVRDAAWAEVAVWLMTRFLRGRFDRGSADVGILSGIGSDMTSAWCNRIRCAECIIWPGCDGDYIERIVVDELTGRLEDLGRRLLLSASP